MPRSPLKPWAIGLAAAITLCVLLLIIGLSLCLYSGGKPFDLSLGTLQISGLQITFSTAILLAVGTAIYALFVGTIGVWFYNQLIKNPSSKYDVEIFHRIWEKYFGTNQK